MKHIIHRFLVIGAFAILIIPTLSYAEIINRQLQVGMRGTDVSLVQAFLAKDPELYPQGLVTGYFGFLTKAAVSNFQSRNGIDPVGRIGPVTLPVINLQMAVGGTTIYTSKAPMITGVCVSTNRNSVVVNWNTDEYAKGVVYYSTNPLITYERTNSVDVSGSIAMTDEGMRTSQNVSIPNLQPNTVYYYMIYTTDQQGNVSVTWPTIFQTSN
jgi:peptidoglycan hydrolase-like protein with peptidoglycan-binding domain